MISSSGRGTPPSSTSSAPHPGGLPVLNSRGGLRALRSNTWAAADRGLPGSRTWTASGCAAERPARRTTSARIADTPRVRNWSWRSGSGRAPCSTCRGTGDGARASIEAAGDRPGAPRARRAWPALAVRGAAAGLGPRGWIGRRSTCTCPSAATRVHTAPTRRSATTMRSWAIHERRARRSRVVGERDRRLRHHQRLRRRRDADAGAGQRGRGHRSHPRPVQAHRRRRDRDQSRRRGRGHRRTSPRHGRRAGVARCAVVPRGAPHSHRTDVRSGDGRGRARPARVRRVRVGQCRPDVRVARADRRGGRRRPGPRRRARRRPGDHLPVVHVSLHAGRPLPAVEGRPAAKPSRAPHAGPGDLAAGVHAAVSIASPCGDSRRGARPATRR